MVGGKIRAVLSSILVLCMLITTIIPGALAFAEGGVSENLVEGNLVEENLVEGDSVENVAESVYGDYPTDWAEYHIWKEGLATQNIKPQDGSGNFYIKPMSLNGNMMSNDYIAAYIENV